MVLGEERILEERGERGEGGREGGKEGERDMGGEGREEDLRERERENSKTLFSSGTVLLNGIAQHIASLSRGSMWQGKQPLQGTN